MSPFSAVQRKSFSSLHTLRRIIGLKCSLWYQQRFQGVALLLSSWACYLYCTMQQGQDLAKLKLMEQIQSHGALPGSGEVPAQIKRNTDVVPQYLHPNKGNFCACGKTLKKLFCFWSNHFTASPEIFSLSLFCAADIVMEVVTR